MNYEKLTQKLNKESYKEGYLRGSRSPFRRTISSIFTGPQSNRDIFYEGDQRGKINRIIKKANSNQPSEKYISKIFEWADNVNLNVDNQSIQKRVKKILERDLPYLQSKGKLIPKYEKKKEFEELLKEIFDK